MQSKHRTYTQAKHTLSYKFPMHCRVFKQLKHTWGQKEPPKRLPKLRFSIGFSAFGFFFVWFRFPILFASQPVVQAGYADSRVVIATQSSPVCSRQEATATVAASGGAVYRCHWQFARACAGFSFSTAFLTLLPLLLCSPSCLTCSTSTAVSIIDSCLDCYFGGPQPVALPLLHNWQTALHSSLPFSCLLSLTWTFFTFCRRQFFECSFQLAACSL